MIDDFKTKHLKDNIRLIEDSLNVKETIIHSVLGCTPKHEDFYVKVLRLSHAIKSLALMGVKQEHLLSALNSPISDDAETCIFDLVIRGEHLDLITARKVAREIGIQK